MVATTDGGDRVYTADGQFIAGAGQIEGAGDKLIDEMPGDLETAVGRKPKSETAAPEPTPEPESEPEPEPEPEPEQEEETPEIEVEAEIEETEVEAGLDLGL